MDWLMQQWILHMYTLIDSFSTNLFCISDHFQLDNTAIFHSVSAFLLWPETTLPSPLSSCNELSGSLQTGPHTQGLPPPAQSGLCVHTGQVLNTPDKHSGPTLQLNAEWLLQQMFSIFNICQTTFQASLTTCTHFSWRLLVLIIRARVILGHVGFHNEMVIHGKCIFMSGYAHSVIGELSKLRQCFGNSAEKTLL